MFMVEGKTRVPTKRPKQTREKTPPLPPAKKGRHKWMQSEEDILIEHFGLCRVQKLPSLDSDIFFSRSNKDKCRTDRREGPHPRALVSADSAPKREQAKKVACVCFVAYASWKPFFLQCTLPFEIS